MDQAKHTPAPWRAERYENFVGGFGVRVVCTVTGETICDDEPYYPHALDPAYASLIAAAPEMLSALQDLLDAVTGRKVGDALAVMNAQAAINKATGGSR